MVPERHWPKRASRKDYGLVYATGSDPRPTTWADGKAIYRAFGIVQPLDVVDCGCGDGRLFPFLMEARRICAVDPCVEMLAHARKQGYVETNGYELQKLPTYDGALPFLDGEFDLAVSANVMAFIPREESRLDFAIGELVRVARFALLISFYTAGKTEMAPHNWDHPYPEVFADMKLTVQELGTGPDHHHFWLLSQPRRTR